MCLFKFCKSWQTPTIIDIIKWKYSCIRHVVAFALKTFCYTKTWNLVRPFKSVVPIICKMKVSEQVAQRVTSSCQLVYYDQNIVGKEKSWELFRFLVSWLALGHMTRKQRWCGLSCVLRDPCLTKQTCNFIYPISGARIEACVVMHTDKRTDLSMKEAFMLRVLEALPSVPLAHPCADHKAAVWLQWLELQKLLKGIDNIKFWKSNCDFFIGRLEDFSQSV